ncbi:MAG: hypothetical protein WBP34_03240 [Thermoanaerobaculia bacterium]
MCARFLPSQSPEPCGVRRGDDRSARRIVNDSAIFRPGATSSRAGLSRLGTARFLLTDAGGYFGALEAADPGFSQSDLGPGQDNYRGDTVDRIQEFGFEAGGPAWRDRVWLWASWGQNDINRITGSGQSDRTILEGTAVKLNAQFTAANSFVAAFNNGDKQKVGRVASPDKDPSSTWNQRGPTGITKVEDTRVFASGLFLPGRRPGQEGLKRPGVPSGRSLRQ